VTDEQPTVTTNRIEKTFELRVAPARAWELFADSHERSQWEALEYEIDPRPGGVVRWSLPGIESNGHVEEAEPEKVLRHVESSGPHSGCEITVTFEATDSGTRVSITHAGFGSADEWDEWLDGTSLGWDQAIADLFLYVETGVPARRFATRMHPPGMTMTERPAGLEVRTVAPGQLADHAGLQPGDLILRVAGTPVFTIRELWVLMREHTQGEELTVDYVRNRERGHGVGMLTGDWH
jgi:uncharacterized protein YndB with AHSA1/START domain